MVVAGLVIGTAAIAQEKTGGKTAEERAQIRTEWMVKELSLTDAQKTQVANINLADAQQHETIRKDAALNEDQKKEAWKASRATHQAKLKEVLTPEQLAALDAKKDERKAHHKDGDSKHHGDQSAEEKAAFRTDHLTKELSLTEAQQAQALKINTEALQKSEAIRKDASLTEEQKEKAIRENRNAHMQQFKAILTPEQLKILKAKKEEMKEHKGEKGSKKRDPKK